MPSPTEPMWGAMKIRKLETFTNRMIGFVRVTTDVTNLAGNPIPKEIRYQFTTMQDERLCCRMISPAATSCISRRRFLRWEFS